MRDVPEFDRDQSAPEMGHVTTLRVNRFFTRQSDRDPRRQAGTFQFTGQCVG
jgi:hypothetical protein